MKMVMKNGVLCENALLSIRNRVSGQLLSIGLTNIHWYPILKLSKVQFGSIISAIDIEGKDKTYFMVAKIDNLGLTIVTTETTSKFRAEKVIENLGGSIKIQSRIKPR